VSLLSLLDLALLGRAGHPALEADQPGGGTLALTFGDLEARSNAMAAALAARGLAPGDRLGIFLANRAEFVDLWLATVKLGVIAVPTNVLYRERELTHIVKDSAPRAVVTTADLAPHLPAGTVTWPLDALVTEAAGHAGAARPAATLIDRTPAALIYTSGTTGAAKGAVLTHGNFAANARAIVAAWRITAADRFLCTLPLFHVHGLGNGIHAWLATGCHMRLVERFEGAKAEGWFTAYRPTLFFGVPTMYVRLLELPPESARAIGAAARLFVSGSAPLPPHVLEAFRDRYGHVILERYGMTETLMIAGNPYDGERRAGTVGPPFPGVELRVRTEARDDCPDGTPGEVWVRGANVCDGYWQRPDATAAAFDDGWFRTGDLGVRSADGYLTLQGRRSELIISGGFNIYPREIEELLLEAPGVREATVVGASDPVRGEVPVAYLVSDQPLDAAALEARLRAQLASFKLPRAFVRVDALPRTALGKVQKHLLPPWTP
jgi:malonyl-CoA/methylmalonyl-CoA synthetase